MKIKSWLLLILLLTGNVGASISLKLNTSSISKQATLGNLNQGHIDYPSASKLTIVADQTWKLYLRAEQTKFVTSNGEKPLSDFLWKLDSGFQELTAEDVKVTEGKEDATLEMDYRIKLTWLDPPDTYGVTLLYTLLTD